jgi:phenylacetate-CoA ligase
MYWDKEAETLKPDELARVQEKRLKHLVNYVYDKSPFYRKKFDEMKIKRREDAFRHEEVAVHHED